MKKTNEQDVNDVAAAYVMHHPRRKITAKDCKLIEERLAEGYSVGDLIDAIEGCHGSPFHCGDNERSTRYDSLGLILRNAENVARFIELGERKEGPTSIRLTSAEANVKRVLALTRKEGEQ